MRNGIKKGLFIAAAVFVGLFALNRMSQAPAQPEQQARPAQTLLPSPQQLQQVLSEHPSWRAEWQRVEVEQTGKDYRIGLFYKDMPSGHPVVERDGKAVAQAALDALVASGRNPAGEPVFLSVWLKRDERGATGKAQVRMFGSVTYDAVSDTLNYRPFK